MPVFYCIGREYAVLPLGHMGITVLVVKIVEKITVVPWVDYRLLLVASLVPDLIDKPIGYLLGVQPFLGGTHYGHSLWLLVIMLMIAFIQWYYWNNRTVLIFVIGTLSHDMLDIVSHHKDWMDRALFDFQRLLILEVIGGCILIYFFCSLALANKVEAFIKKGEL